MPVLEELLPDEKLFVPGGLTQCLFFKNHEPVKPQNAHSVGRTGKQPAQLCQLLPVHQAVRCDFGVGDPQRPPERSAEQNMNRWEKTHVNDVGEDT